MKKKKLAILGATGHIAKSLIHIFCEKNNYELFLFSRTPTKVEEFLKEYNKIHHVFHLVWFDAYDYDVVINCIGMGNPAEIKNGGIRIFEITEKYDNMIIEYLRSHIDTLYINLSSGSVSNLDMNHLTSESFYGIAKLNSEVKHWSLETFSIVDLRIFGYFSRYINQNYKYLMTDIVKCIKNHKTLETTPENIIRDYIHPEDLYSLIEKCIDVVPLNTIFDAYSKEPVSKFDLLDWLQQKYGLQYIVNEKLNIESPTGTKYCYYSVNKKAEKVGYSPKYTSLQSVQKEIEYLL